MRLGGLQPSKAVLATALAAGAFAAGCGSDDSSTAGEPYDVEASTTMLVAEPPISKSEFVIQVNDSCRKGWRTIRSNWVIYTSTQERKLSARRRFDEAVRRALLASLDFQIFDSIRILGAPRGEEREIETIIGPFQEAVELGWKARWRAYSIAEVPPRFATYNRRAARYGLVDCLVDKAHLRGIETNQDSQG